MTYRLTTRSSDSGSYDHDHPVFHRTAAGEITNEHPSREAALAEARNFHKPCTVHCPDGKKVYVGADGVMHPGE